MTHTRFPFRYFFFSKVAGLIPNPLQFLLYNLILYKSVRANQTYLEK